MIAALLLLGLGVVGAVGGAALHGHLRGRHFVAILPGRRAAIEPPHRQAIHHFASGVLPPWR